jgi:hypothetical protein
MLSSSTEQSKFKAESSLAPTLREIEFLVKVNVIEKEAKNCFKKIEKIFNDLQAVTQKVSILETKIIVCDPSEKSQRFKKFEISSESGLKDKMNVSLDIRVIVSFDDKMDFWKKGLSLSSAIDVLESFCENARKEKNVFTWLDRAKFSEEKNEEDNSELHLKNRS